MKKQEIHLFIIWQNARFKEKEILEDISKNFEVLKTIEVTWKKRNFSKNLTRFYGKNLPSWSHKERECGAGPFLLVLIRDPKPVYEERDTSHGREVVNAKIFDKKTLYRKWTNGDSKVHATNSTMESDHDLVLLLGTSIYDVEDRLFDLPDKYNEDLIGAHGWDDLSQFFYVLNHTTNYLVLRNYEFLPDRYRNQEHGDVDLLTDDYDGLRYIVNGKKVYKRKYRVYHKVRVGNEMVYFDFRHLGDGYYDELWEKKLLANRQKNTRNIYVPDLENYKFSLLYHALVHKTKIATDYDRKINEIFGSLQAAEEQLNEFLARNKFKYTEPEDLSVYFDITRLNGDVSYRRKMSNQIIKAKKKVMGYVKR